MTTNKRRKIGIIGLGPIGQILAVQLNNNENDIILYDIDKEKIRQIQDHGVKLTGVFEKKALFSNVCDNIDDFLSHKPEIIVISVKSFQINTLYTKLSRYKRDYIIVAAQNGIDIEEDYLNYVEKSNVIRMVVTFAGRHTSPCSTKVTFFNSPNYLGPVYSSKSNETILLAKILTSQGLTTEFADSDSIKKSTWKKAILNSSISPVCAVLDMNIFEIMNNTYTREIVERMLNEDIKIAKKEKIDLNDKFYDMCMEFLLSSGDHLPSLAKDWILGVETEIDCMNGKFIEYGKKHKLNADYNTIYYNMIKSKP